MDSLNIKVIGYYDKFNIGDEQYKETISFILNTYLRAKFDIEFINSCSIDNIHFNESDIIIAGGGDILNDFFINKLSDKFKNKNNKLIALSVGLPFTSTLTNTTKLNIFDYIFLRTKQDMNIFNYYYHHDRVFYIPDVSIILPRLNFKPSYNIRKIITRLSSVRKTKKILAVCLSNSIYSKDRKENYDTILTKLAMFLKSQNINYHLLFIPFSVDLRNNSQNDLLIQNDIRDMFLNTHNMTFIEEFVGYENIMEIFNNVDITISMKYHGCLFSIYKNKPVFPIFTTRKIKNLLLDMEWMYGYEFQVDKNYIPLDIDLDILQQRFDGMIDSFSERYILRKKMEDYTRQEYLNLKSCINEVTDVLLKQYDKKIIQSLYNNYLHNTDEKIKNVYKIVQDFAKNNGCDDFRKLKKENLKKITVCLVSYLLTNGSIESPYKHGLETKMFSENYNYIEEWKWIINDCNFSKNKNLLLNNPKGIFNIGYIDQIDYSKSHRCGWQYVYDNIKHLHNSNAVLLDMYIDRTFHWDLDICKILNIIPYTKPWIGFIHHTFESEFTEYNCGNLFNNELFLESLKTCKGLFVLSEYLKNQLQLFLDNLCIPVQVYNVIHPTEINVEKFDYKNFKKNRDKKMLNIGGWYRNVYTFFNLVLPNNTKFRKVILRGKNMSNYYPNNEFLDYILEFCKGNKDNIENDNENDKNCSRNCSRNCSTSSNKIVNNWFRFFYNDIYEKFNMINYIDHVTDEMYDELLTKNIVFIHLVDASGVNTLIECIVRETPIIINKHPAVVELLGEDYPLYFPDTLNYFSINKSVEKLLTNDTIKSANEYLSRIDKDTYNIKTFIKKFESIVKNKIPQ